MGDPYSISQILWSADPATQRAITMVLGLAFVAVVTVFVPLIVRLFRLYMLERRLLELIEYALGASSIRGSDRTKGQRHAIEPDELRGAFADSPIPGAYEEFERRWTTARLGDSIERAPIRLMDIFDERPLLPYGARRSLLPILPGLLLTSGVFAALFGLIPSLASMAADELSGDARSAWMVAQMGLALRAAAWGFLCAMGASILGRLIEGAFESRSFGLDAIVEGAFGSVSPGELAEITRRSQQQSIGTLGRELSQFANELNERLDRGLQRIEQSTARSANLVSQEQRGALHTVVQELSLSVRQGVEHHLSELRNALQRAVEHQSSVTGGLAETFERMVENSRLQDRVARTLADSANSVEEAAHAMRGSSKEMKPILEHLSSTSHGLSNTAERIAETQKVVARTAEGVRSSLEHAASGVDDQRQFIEVSLGEIRQALHGLGDGLGESLQRSLRSVDDVLSGTIGQLRDTLAESNETIDRLTIPIRAAEGSTRETHLALDRVKTEVEALGLWLTQALKPLRSGLTDVEGRADEIARTMTDFSNHTRQIDRTMESLRKEIHEESQRLQGTGSELSRQLKLASDAVGLIESTTRDDPQRTAKDSSITAHERSWSAAPSSHETPLDNSSAETKSRDDSTQAEGSLQAEGSFPAEGSLRAEGSPPVDRSAPAGDSTTGPMGRDLANTGYRVGAPRAQGPDPYSRLEAESREPSNIRHFPTPDRELGDNLKLSGLLGPRDHGSTIPTSSQVNRLGPAKASTRGKTRSADSEDADSKGSDSVSDPQSKNKGPAGQSEPS